MGVWETDGEEEDSGFTLLCDGHFHSCIYVRTGEMDSCVASFSSHKLTAAWVNSFQLDLCQLLLFVAQAGPYLPPLFNNLSFF